MPLKKTKILKAAIALLVITVVPMNVASASPKDDTIRFSAEQVPESVDPFFNNVRIGVILGQMVWDTLIYRDPNSGEYKGQLAKAWNWVDDTTLSLTLREGVKFHNGEEFDADDVVYTLNFIANPDNKVITQSNVNWIASAEKLSKYQVRVKLKKPFPAAIDYLAGPVVIHPNEYYAQVGPAGMSLKPVGSGPYRVAEMVQGKVIKLVANPDYPKDLHKAAPKIKNLEIRFLPDRQTQNAELMAENLDFIMGVQRDQAVALKNVPHLQSVEGGTMRIVFLNLNTREGGPLEAMRDIRVRKAIAHAIPKASIAKQLVGEKAWLIDVVCFPSQFGCSDVGVPTYNYDVSKSRELLKQAGFGDNKKLEFDIYAYRERDQTEAFIGALRAVGITANLKFMQSAASRDMIRSNKVAVSHQTWGSFSVNDTSASTSNYFKFGADDMARDPEIRDLLERGDTSVDPAVRRDAYRRALVLIQERVLAVPLYTLTTNYVASKHLKFNVYPDEVPRFWEMSWN